MEMGVVDLGLVVGAKLDTRRDLKAVVMEVLSDTGVVVWEGAEWVGSGG